MQFHENGFRYGDPDRRPSAGRSANERVDVLIVGCGPAGLTLAAQMGQFPDITTRIIEQKYGPLELGQADGIACRSMEMFNAFGFVERVMREAYWVNETVFWKPDPNDPGRIARSGRIQDVEDGLSEFPHVILNQARVHDFYLDVMRNAPARLEPDYQRRLRDLEVDRTAEYPVTATVERLDTDETETIKARYVVGCDGARSQVRRSIGRDLRGDSANQAWGVMDVLLNTDFPDIRFKCTVHSSAGNSVLIPREGGYLARLCIEMEPLGEDERAKDRNVTVDDIIAAANEIYAPYSIDVKEVAWWSVYEIGQRLTDAFHDDDADPRVFIAGDACHTHSPKAGQGMNVSMADGFNLGWKLASALRGLARTELLRSYFEERQAVAYELIEFDKELARRIGVSAKAGEDTGTFQEFFQEAGRYTAGVATHYAAGLLTGGGEHQHLATGFEIGKRFHSSPVMRLADGKHVHLGHVMKADGRWRIFVFEGANGGLARLCEFLTTDPASPIQRHTPKGADIDSVIDLRAVIQSGHRETEITVQPEILFPSKGRLGLRDYEKVFCSVLKEGPDIFEIRGINREKGCLVVVRPDHYVSAVLPLDGYGELSRLFANVLT